MTNTVDRQRDDLSSAYLDSEIKNIEAEMESMREKRAECQASFAAFDQKANELSDMLSQLLSAMEKLKDATIRNIS